MRHLALHFFAAARCLVLAGALGLAFGTAEAQSDELLSPRDVARAVDVLRASGHATVTTRFAFVQAYEPCKASCGESVPLVEVIAYDVTSALTHRAVIDLSASRVRSWSRLRGRPRFFAEEHALADSLVSADPRWQRALRRRGFARSQDVLVALLDTRMVPSANGARRSDVAAVPFAWSADADAPVAVVEGLVAYLDLPRRRITQILEDGSPGPHPPSTPADVPLIGRRPVRPAAGTPPAVASSGAVAGLRLDGRTVETPHWRFRLEATAREGVVVERVTYRLRGGYTSVLHRGSVAELIVLYADPKPEWRMRAMFDGGGAGLGLGMKPLTAADLPGPARLLPATMHDDFGSPRVVADAIAIFRMPPALSTITSNGTERTSDLAVRSKVVVGNYTYVFTWLFRDDGTIVMEVAAGGYLAVRTVRPGSGSEFERPYGRLVAPGIEAINHQHFVSLRLDFDIGGPNNTIVESMVTPDFPRQAAHGLFRTTPRWLETEGGFGGPASRESRWRVVSTTSVNPLGEAIGYGLSAEGTSRGFIPPDLHAGRWARFLTRPLWVTRYDARERYPAGELVMGSDVANGVREWAADKAVVAGADLVVWYTLVMTHLPRSEEYPRMNVHRMRLRMEPVGFVGPASPTDTETPP